MSFLRLLLFRISSTLGGVAWTPKVSMISQVICKGVLFLRMIFVKPRQSLPCGDYALPSKLFFFRKNHLEEVNVRSRRPVQLSPSL